MESLIIQAEDTHFCVPKYVLALPGTSFESMLLLPQSQSSGEAGFMGQQAKGRDASNPIKLDQGITALQFTHFLSIVLRCTQPPTPITIDDWMGIYDLASKWSFEKVRVQARNELDRQLSSMSGVECIKLGKKHNVSPWVKGGLIKLIRNDEPLDIQLLYEGGLDTWTICTILSIRETCLLASNPTSVTGSTATKAQHFRSTLIAQPSIPDLQVEQVKAQLRDLGDEEALDLVQNKLVSQFGSLTGNGKDELKLPSSSAV